MVEDVYKNLAQKPDACPSGYPRTDTGNWIKDATGKDATLSCIVGAYSGHWRV